MKYIRLTLVVLVAFWLSGYITRCWQETFFKPTAVAGEGYTISSTNGHLFIERLPSGVSVEIFECGTAYRRADNGPVSVCLNIINGSAPSAYFLTQTISASGVSEKQLPAMMLTTSTPDRNRPNVNFISVKFPEVADTEITLQFPLLQVGGKQVQLPKVSFRRVTEQRCGQFA